MFSHIRLLIVDAHPIVRQGLIFALEPKFGIEVIGEAKNGIEAIEKAIQLQPDVISMDLVMPKKDGLDAIKEIKQKIPTQKILVLTSYMGEGKLISAIKNGALGYILKDSPPEELIRAILEVAEGNLYLQKDIATEFVSEMQYATTKTDIYNHLTEKELEILKSLAKGLPNKSIASLLHISTGTVRTHVSNILRKLELENRTQAAMFAWQQGLVDILSPKS